MSLAELEARRREVAAFDVLPPALRQVLSAGAYDVRPSEVLAAFNQIRWQMPASIAALELGKMLREAEGDALRQFGAHYQQRYGATLPHIAAGATLMRG